jgi:hypothetical protein
MGRYVRCFLSAYGLPPLCLFLQLNLHRLFVLNITAPGLCPSVFSIMVWVGSWLSDDAPSGKLTLQDIDNHSICLCHHALACDCFASLFRILGKQLL